MNAVKERIQSLREYKRYKAKILNQLGYSKITLSDFTKAKTEIQVDNMARSILFS